MPTPQAGAVAVPVSETGTPAAEQLRNRSRGPSDEAEITPGDLTSALAFSH